MIDSFWRGPTIQLVLPDKTRVLGEGEPVVTVTVKDSSLARRMMFSTHPSLLFGEAYVDGTLEVSGGPQELLTLLEGYYKTTEDISKTAQAQAYQWLRGLFNNHKINADKARDNARAHYNVGNDFYKLWLDKRLVYTCAYFPEGTEDIDTAQDRKLDLICKKAQLQAGQKIIDLGCGWGGLLMYAAEHYGVSGVGVVAAEEQGEYIRAEAARRGLSDKIEVVIDDWRAATGTFDRVLSVGMMEHVGQKQYELFFEKIRELLKPGGIAFVHTIGRTLSRPTDPWITKYIFPGGWLPTLGEMVNGAARQGFASVHQEDLRQHYAQTLHLWSEKFESTLDITRNMDLGMDAEQFIRMWRLYLLGSEAAFHWGDLHLWQVVLADSKSPVPRQWKLDVI